MDGRIHILSRITLVSVFAIMQLRLEPSNVFLSAILTSLGNPLFLCVVGSRMLFNLKEVGEHGQNEETSYNATSRTVTGWNLPSPDR